MQNRYSKEGGAMKGLLYDKKPQHSVNVIQQNKAKLKAAEAEKQRQMEEQSRAPQDPFKMKKFQNVQSKVTQDLKEQQANEDLKPIAERPQKAPKPVSNQQGLRNTGMRASSGVRQNSGQRNSLRNSGNAIMGSGKVPMARGSSYSGAQKDEKAGGLNSAMLANLNKQNNKKQIERRKSGRGNTDDEIENALELRASRGELPKVAAGGNYEQDEEKASIANGQLPEEVKASESAPAKTAKQNLPPKMPPRKPKANADPPESKNFGKVPKYLQKYNEEAKQKEDHIAAKKAAMVPGQPPGTKLMPEEERLETLRDLENNKKDINEALMKMPISMQSQGLQRRKTELEQKLMQVDKAIEMMSKKQVFVRDD